MEDLTGKQFGPYQIGDPLGEGGMAAVYKAYQPSMERYVAVKVLPRQMADSAEFIARFKREARLLAQLQHPHILPVFDYGQAEGYTYIVMPFVQSGTLADLLRTRRLSLSEIRRIVSQIGDALGYAHARGMIHRDVKPSNVLIDERKNCLLTDFGLARMTDPSGVSAKLTSSGAVMGTPAYMSPEQGAGTNLDGRSDIYSLGIILYEMVTGRVPYSAETPIAIVFKHIQDPLPPARNLVPDLSDELERVLLKSLAKKPADRYQSAEDFVKALQHAIPETATEKPAAVPAASQPTVISAPPRPRPTPPPAPAPSPSIRTVYEPPSIKTVYESPSPRTVYEKAPSPQSVYIPPPQAQAPAQKQGFPLWVLAGAGIIGVCLVGLVLLAIGIGYFGNNGLSVIQPTATEQATATFTAVPATGLAAKATIAPTTPTRAPALTPTSTLPAPPTVVVPPGVKFVRINGITVNAQGQYVVAYETFEYTEVLPGMHVHFFFNTVQPENAGMPGNGPWKIYGGPRPFTGYRTGSRPKNASAMCALVANSDHSVHPNSGNCFPLPDVATATARVDTACRKTPAETGEVLVAFKAGTAFLIAGISNDKGWLSIQNPLYPDNTTCWVPTNSSVIAGNTSNVPSISP